MASSPMSGGVEYGTLSGFSSKFIDKGCLLYKIGRVVVLTLNIQAASAYQGETILNFAPEGFRPINDIAIRAGDGSASGQSIGALRSNGDMTTIYIGSTKYMQGTVVYLT